mgnify:CR=1 FL=1
MSVSETIKQHNEEAFPMPSQYDKAIIGMTSRINFGPVVAYDVEKIIEILAKDMEPDIGDIEEHGGVEDAKYFLAKEYYEFNIIGGYHGPNMPIFVETGEFKEI